MHDSRRKDIGYEEYTRENLVVLQTMLDAGMLRVTERGVKLWLADAVVANWYERMDHFIAQLLGAYQARDAKELALLRTFYCGEHDDGASPGAAALIAMVNAAKS